MVTSTSDVNASLRIDKISPITAVKNVGSQGERLEKRLDKVLLNQLNSGQLTTKTSQINLTPIANTTPKQSQLVQGQVYGAQVLEKIDKQTSLVSINNGVMKMALGSNIKSGQSIALKYIGSLPTPTFQLTQASPTPNIGVTLISASAQLIQYYLHQGKNKPGATHIEAKSPITSSPNNPTQYVAKDLQRAISQTGLFYESHLAANVAGKNNLMDILQEPQNQSAKYAQQIVPQQLNLLENQKIVWHGEIWPKQNMLWEVERKQSHERSVKTSETDTVDSIQSKIHLELPNLGNISVQLQLDKNGMRIELLAKEINTTKTLKTHSETLSNTLQALGQKLQQFSVTHHDTQA